MDAIFGLVRPVDNASKAETQQVEDAHKIKDVGKPQQHAEEVV